MGAAVHVVGYEIAGFLEGGCLFGWRFGVGGGGVEGWEDERGGVGDFYFGVAFAAGEFEVVGEFLGEGVGVGGFGDGSGDVGRGGGPGVSGGFVGHEHCVETARAEKVVVDLVEEGVGSVAALGYYCCSG